MPAANHDLLTRAQGRRPEDPRVLDCWSFVTRGIELGWLDLDELRDLADYLQAGRDWGVEELLFANLGDEVRVSLLDDEAVCLAPPLVDEIRALLDSLPRA